MSAAVYEEVFRFVTTKTDDPEIKARQLRAVEILAETTPEVTEKIETRGQLKGERVALRRVLAARRLALSAEQEARINACTDLETLSRWVEQAVVAESVAEALR